MKKRIIWIWVLLGFFFQGCGDNDKDVSDHFPVYAIFRTGLVDDDF